MFCPVCGAPNEDDAEFCGNCGASLKAIEGPAEAVVPGEAPAGAGSESTVPPSPAEAGPGPQVAEEPAPEPQAAGPTPISAPPSVSPAPPPSRWSPAARTVETSGLAVASLVAGIAGLSIVPFLGSILALILGYMARNEIRRRPGELGGEGFATAGIVLGWIAVGLTLVLLCCGAIAAIFFIVVSPSSGTPF